MVFPLIVFGKLIGIFSRLINLGSGGTWPGEIAVRLNKNILSLFCSTLNRGVILVAGTNGKTTSTLMIKNALEKEGYKVIHNRSGANLVNGLVSAFIENASWNGQINADYGVFEVDENSLPAVISNIKYQISNKNKKLIIVLLNLFRDQLDRYGEVDVIAEKWEKSISKLPSEPTIILNADDPLVAYLGQKTRAKTIYFGLEKAVGFKKELEHATDSTFCLSCGGRLSYEKIYYSHLGHWFCQKCGLKRIKPQVMDFTSPLSGTYNAYNTQAAAAVLLALGMKEKGVKSAISKFNPAFGRQEEFKIKGNKNLPAGRRVKIFLSKNPTGFNESLRTVISLEAKNILLVLNDEIPDGRDVSWIWDVDFEMIPARVSVIVSGERVYDLAVRLKYSSAINNQQLTIESDLRKAISIGLDEVDKEEVLYILPTYSAMLEVRKILKGRKIL